LLCRQTLDCGQQSPGRFTSSPSQQLLSGIGPGLAQGNLWRVEGGFGEEHLG